MVANLSGFLQDHDSEFFIALLIRELLQSYGCTQTCRAATNYTHVYLVCFSID